MLKKIIIILCMLGLLIFSFRLLKKSEKIEITNTNEDSKEIVRDDVLPDKTYTINIENISPQCMEQDEILCAVEKAVKCTINMNMDGCRQLELPSFIFMTDESIERPTEISYKFTNKKYLPNNTVEIHTNSACNGKWFGLCQGTIIYILAPANNNVNQWHVKDIYAIE